MLKYLEHKEKYFFYGVLALITILYLLSGFNKYSDGFFHLQSAETIKYLLTNTCPDAAKIFKLNSMIVPNWASVAIMLTLLLLGIPSIIVQKVTFCLAFIIIILGFRYLIYKGKGNIILSWLGLGFAFNNIILAGTYNTAFALGLIFFSIGYYEENKNNIQSIKFNIIFCILITCTWFSHFLIYFIGGVIIFFYELFDLTQHVKRLGFNFSNIYTFIRSRLLLLICYIPSLVLSANYLLSDRETFHLFQEAHTYELILSQLGNFVLLQDFFIILLSLEYIIFNNILIFLYYIFIICLGSFFFLYPKKDCKIYKHPLFISLIFVLILSSVVSGGLGGAWQLGWRIRIIAWYLIFFLFSYCTERNKIISFAIIIFSILSCSVNLIYMFQQSGHESKTADIILNGIPTIESQSNIYTIRFDKTKQINTIYDVLTKDKACVLEIHNYQSNYDYFPIIENASQIDLPNFYPLYDKKTNHHFLSDDMTNVNLALYSSTANINIDYVFIWGDTIKERPKFVRIRNSYIRKNKATFEKNFYGYLEKNMQLIHSYKDKNGKYSLRIYKRLPQ